MVLICNNNVLTIEKFHKNRCEEKKAIKDIILNHKEIKEKYYKETPPKEVEQNTTYASSTRGIDIRHNKSIYFTKSNSTRK